MLRMLDLAVARSLSSKASLRPNELLNSEGKEIGAHWNPQSPNAAGTFTNREINTAIVSGRLRCTRSMSDAFVMDTFVSCGGIIAVWRLELV